MGRAESESGFRKSLENHKTQRTTVPAYRYQYYSPIWIAMRWYKARAFMRHHKTPGAASAPTPIKHKGLIPFSSKLVIQQG